MIGFLLAAQRPPEAQRITEIVIMRHDHVYEVDPSLMQTHVEQQDIPAWDTQRMVDARMAYLLWTQAHWSDVRISGDQLLAEIEAEEAHP